MINTPYVKKDSVSNYFPVPNAVFDLELHHIEIDIYAYLMRIENRRTYQCLASYPTIAKKLGLSVNTVARYVAALVSEALDSEALDSEAPMNYEEIERQAEKLLQTMPPFPIIIGLRTSHVSPAVGPCERLCAAFTCEVGCRHHYNHGRPLFTHFRGNFRGRFRAPAEAQRSGSGGKRRSST